MKLNFLKYMLVGVIIFAFACNKQTITVPTNTDWNGEEFPVSGGLLEFTNSSLAYVVGNQGPYKIEFKVFQGAKNYTKSVDIYVQFYHFEHLTDSEGKDSVVTYLTNKKKLSSVTVTETVTHFETVEFSYSDLITDLRYEDSEEPLPTADTSLSIGDYFELTFVSNIEDGNSYQSAVKPTLTVSGRYAGKWKVTYITYYRIDEFHDWVDTEWKGQEITLQSVDATTYEYKDWAAFVGWEGTLKFSVDPATLKVSYNPDDLSLNGQPFITPLTNMNDFQPTLDKAAAAGYSEYNIVINDDVNGKDRIILAYGYYTAGSGPRAFFEVLDKIVE